MPFVVLGADGVARFTDPIPPPFEDSGFRLEPLGPEHTTLDYRAVLGARERLRRVFLPEDSWPPDDLTEAHNRADLVRHEREFSAREALAWSVLAPDRRRVLGCVYLDPHTGPCWDAEGYWWLAEPEFRRGRDSAFGRLLRRWLARHHPGLRVAWPGRRPPWGPWLTYCAEHDVPSRHGHLPQR